MNLSVPRLLEAVRIIHAEDPTAKIYASEDLLSFNVDFPRFSRKQLERLSDLGFQHDAYLESIWVNLE